MARGDRVLGRSCPRENTRRPTMRSSKITLGALIVSLMLYTTAALAVDGKEYPGSMCKEGVDGYHIKRATGDIVFDFDGNAQHIGTAGFRYVSCPLVRDAERLSGNITYAAVNVYKPSSTGQY